MLSLALQSQLYILEGIIYLVIGAGTRTHLTTSATSPLVFASVCLSVCACCCRSQYSERAYLAGAEELLHREDAISVSALVFLAIVFASILAISVIIALMIWDSEQETLIQTTIEVFWVIVHFGVLAVFVVFYTAILLTLLWDAH